MQLYVISKRLLAKSRYATAAFIAVLNPRFA